MLRGVVWDEGDDLEDDDCGHGEEGEALGSNEWDEQPSQEDASKTAEIGGKGKARRKNATTSATTNIDNRRRWEPTPVFGMDSDDDEEDNNERNDNHDDNDDAEEDDDCEILFDSQDEDECDDLFAGVWNADVVRQRRMSRR